MGDQGGKREHALPPRRRSRNAGSCEPYANESDWWDTGEGYCLLYCSQVHTTVVRGIKHTCSVVHTSPLPTSRAFPWPQGKPRTLMGPAAQQPRLGLLSPLRCGIWTVPQGRWHRPGPSCPAPSLGTMCLSTVFALTVVRQRLTRLQSGAGPHCGDTPGTPASLGERSCCPYCPANASPARVPA